MKTFRLTAALAAASLSLFSCQREDVQPQPAQHAATASADACTQTTERLQLSPDPVNSRRDGATGRKIQPNQVGYAFNGVINLAEYRLLRRGSGSLSVIHRKCRNTSSSPQYSFVVISVANEGEADRLSGTRIQKIR